MMNKLACAILVLACTLPSLSAAQKFQSLGGQDGTFHVRTVPPQPGPNQLVNVIVENYATDLDRATISWFLDNVLTQEAIGQKTFTFKTGKAGSVSDILIVARTADGNVFQQSLAVRPASVDLVWEAQSYIPPFYRGKAAYPYQGTVKVVAMPNIVTENGGLLDAKKLVYTWKVDGKTMGDASGYGKNFILYQGRIPLRNSTIEVEAASFDKTYVAAGKTTLTPAKPRVLLYEDSPLYGILYNKALGASLALKNEEIKIAAIPYFVGVKERDENGLSYDWRVNDEKTAVGQDKSGLTFRQEKGARGRAVVTLQVSNPEKIFQFAGNSLSISFGGSTAGQF